MWSKIALCALAVAAGPAVRASLDIPDLDPSVRPQDNFFKYVNGIWLKTTPIPAQYSSWGSVIELREACAQNLRVVCERASAVDDQGTPAERMVGDFYASALDTSAIRANGSDPLRFELNRIDALQGPADVLLEIAHLQSLGVNASFAFSSEIDPKNSAREIAALSQGGLGLPDRDYYFRPEDRDLRERYTAHIARLLALTGIGDDPARAQAEAVLRIETELARAASTNVALRDPAANHHLMSLDQLAAAAPGPDWRVFFARTSAPAFSDLDVQQPAFFAAFARLMGSTSLADWQGYLRWHFIHEYAPFLSDPFVAEDFSFYGTALTGAAQLQPRWRRAVATIDDSIGEDLGQLYVAAYFPPEAKARMLDLVGHVRAALRARLQSLDWMDEPTRELALAKLDLMGLKIGYPDHWRDYGSLAIDRGPYVLNVLKARAWEVRRVLHRIGQATDPAEWEMTPSTVNAYYSQSHNEIVFPAAILQSPFFDPAADDAVNYGAIGAIIGHEMTHAFDDQGRKYDGHGNLAQWWTAESERRFRARAAAIVRQFDGYFVTPQLHVNGRLTEGEDIADLGGLKLAYTALETDLGDRPRKKRDGFTPEQRYFLSFATAFRWEYRPEALNTLVKTNPHSPAEFRVNGPMSNLDAFARAFAVPDGAPMRRPAAERVEIW